MFLFWIARLIPGTTGVTQSSRESKSVGARCGSPEDCRYWRMKTFSLPGTRGMSVVMKNGQKNVLPFPPPAAQPEAATIIVQIGNERFAIHWEVEDLPPAAKPLPWRKEPWGTSWS